MLYPEDSQEWTPWLPVTPAGPHWLWLHPGRAWSRGHAGRPWPLLMASRRLSVLACTDTLKLLGPCYFAYSCSSPLPLRWLGPEPISSWSLQAKQEHFPPNSFVLEDKRTEGLYKAQKQMSFTEFTIFIHSLQVPLVATDGVILLRVLFCFSNLQVFCS